MKRDMDLIREILLKVEDMDLSGSDTLLTLEGRDHEVVYQHARLLQDAGFLEFDLTMGPRMHVNGLTWEGHDLLDTIRDDSMWAAMKRKLAKVGGSASLEILKALGVQIAKERLGLTD